MTFSVVRRTVSAALLALAGLPLLSASAENMTPAPVNVDVSALPALGKTWRETNPYRGNATAVSVGQRAFELTCGQCHALADTGGIGPDLRTLDRSCRKIGDAQLRARCLTDQDVYFRDTVLEGKVVVGVRHMPAWREALSQEAIWAIRSFIEARSAERKRTTTSVEDARRE